jgi:hypothetical protein
VIVMPYSGELRAFTGCADNVSGTWRLPACKMVSRASIPGHSGINAITALRSGYVLYASGSAIYGYETCASSESSLTIQLDSEIQAMAKHGDTVIVATKLGLLELEIPPSR